MDASEIARKAADYIRINGHTKNELWNAEGNACFQGAVCAVMLGKEKVLGYSNYSYWEELVPVISSDETRAIIETATGIIRERDWGVEPMWQIGDTVFDPISYNNADETTAEDVIYLLELAAKELDEQRSLPG